MDLIETLLARNETFVETRFSPDRKIMPSLRTMIIGCVDPRVDPADIFGLEPGEAAVIRNVGGRIVPMTLQTMAMLRVVSRASGGDLGAGWNLIVLHHTDCGIKCLSESPEMLAKYLGVAPYEIDAVPIADPHEAVAFDVAALKANPAVPGGFIVSGLVYDVATGHVEMCVPPSILRPDEHELPA